MPSFPGVDRSGFRIGQVVSVGDSSVPLGTLLCDGSAKDANADPTLQKLFDTIGNTYGGSDNTDFQVPDFRGRTLIGDGTGDAPAATNHNVGDKEGDETHAISGAESPSHTHTIAHTHGMKNHTHADGSLRADFDGTSNDFAWIAIGPGFSANQTTSGLGHSAIGGSARANSTDVFGSTATPSDNTTDGTNTASSGGSAGIGTGNGHNNLQPSTTCRYVIAFN